MNENLHVLISLNIKYLSSFIAFMFKQRIFKYYRHFTVTLEKILITKLKNNHPFSREKQFNRSSISLESL